VLIYPLTLHSMKDEDMQRLLKIITHLVQALRFVNLQRVNFHVINKHKWQPLNVLMKKNDLNAQYH